MLRDAYTRYPRTILWLVRGGTLCVPDRSRDSLEIEPFYMGKTPITNSQYEAFRPQYERSPVSPGDDDPAVGISYRDASGYCDWYARVSRKAMRLPGEWEWEYACRAGTASRFFFGDEPEDGEPYLWHAGTSGGRIRDPRLKKANPFGLLGMLGCVQQWTVAAGGEGGREGGVLRGGSALLSLDEMGCGERRAADADTPLVDVGFRIVRSF